MIANYIKCVEYIKFNFKSDLLNKIEDDISYRYSIYQRGMGYIDCMFHNSLIGIQEWDKLNDWLINYWKLGEKNFDQL